MFEPIRPLADPRIRLSVLSDDDIRRIHTATLDVIESVGVRFPSPRALEIWAAHGATVDLETSVVRAPGHLVEDALRTAPPAYTLGAREPEHDVALDGRHVHLGTDGCGVEILDLSNGELRRSELRDVADISRVVDALDEISFIWVPLSAQDMPPETRALHEVATAWRHSTKHVQTESIVTEREARSAVEMATALAGGSAEVRARSPLSLMECTISPLAHDGGALEAALVAAEAGIPVGFMTMASAAFTGPATLAGSLVVGNAEVVSALALLQLAHPGAPVYYAAAQTAIDLRSGAYTGGGPEDFLFGAATNELADFYEVPLSMGAFATGAKTPDWQAGVENSFSAFLASAAASDMLLGAGLLHGSRIWSYEQLLLDCEIFSIVRAVLGGIEVDEQALAREVIAAVGPGGDYLAQRHTRDHMRQLWQPRFLDRRTYSAWQEDPGWARRSAADQARELLRTHQPAPLDEQLAAELGRIIASTATAEPMAAG